MQRLVLVGAPVLFALRRMRERPLSVATVFLAAAATSALVGWSGLAAATSQEDNVRARLRELPADRRALQVVYSTQPFGADLDAATVDAAVRSFGDVTTGRRLVRIWHPIAPPDERGTRLVLAVEPGENVAVAAGRLPVAPCRASSCPALALAGGYRLGQRVRVGRTRIRVVGLGSLRPVALSDRELLGTRALLVRSLNAQLVRQLRQVGTTVVTTAPLDPARVRGFELDSLRERLRRSIVRLERSDPEGLVRASAPLGLLANVAERGRVARTRLLLVAGEGAALIVAFAAFATAARRREARLLEEQLQTLGASRAQVVLARAAETAAPSLVGTGVALAGLLVAAELVARSRGLPASFAGATLPGTTILAIAAVTVAAAALLVASAGRPRRARGGVGALELAALAALGVVVWQTAATGGLDPKRVAREGADPVLLLLPALAFFVTGVVLVRVLPLALRLAERLARKTPFAVRLGFLSAARHPAQAAGATTFLAVALGGSLFSLDYLATLDRQSRDQAAFAAGAEWRVAERSPGGTLGATDVTPLTRFARATRERPTPVLRLDASVPSAEPAAEPAQLQVLALPAARVPALRGWRNGFSPLSRKRIAARLRPRPVRLSGPTIARDATALRVWIQSVTERPRIVVLHFLLPGQGFAHVRAGLVWKRWRRLSLPVPPSLRGAQLVGVELLPTLFLLGRTFDLSAYVELGRFEERRPGGWSELPSLRGWVAAAGDQGGYLVPDAPFAAGSPVAHGVELDLNGTDFPLVRPRVPLPAALPGFAGGPIAAQAVDRVVTVQVAGRELPVRVVGEASLFPTVVDRPSSFVVLDYDTLFAALNADRPGTAVPSEAWFFDPQAPGFADRLERPPFRLAHATGARELEARLLADPLARGTRDVLRVAAALAALLAALGLVLGARSTLASERLLLAEYEALGVPPSTLARSTQIRLLALSLVGLVGGFAGAVLTVRLIGAFVAVTGGAAAPLPPILPHVAWAAGAGVVAAVAVAGVGAAALLAGWALRESAARRLRA